MLQRIFTARRWWELVPEQSVISEGAGEGDTRNAAARSSAGDWLLVYFSHPGTVTLRLNAITTADTVRASWIDTTSGKATEIGTFAASGTQSFTCPEGAEDAVLVVDGEDHASC